MTNNTAFKNTEVGVIPEDWKIQKLGELANVIGGGTPSSFNKSYWNGNINWFTPTEIGKHKYTYESVRKLTKAGYDNCSAKMLPIGSILLTTRAGIGDLSILKTEGCTNQGFQSFVSFDSIDNEFLYYLLSTLKSVFLQNASGSTFLEISPNKLRGIQIPLPPTLTEQTAIATALSDADALISILEKLIAKKKAIKQGAMQELLKPKEGWETKTLGEIADYRNGKSHENNIVSDGLYNLITLNSIDINGKIKSEHLKVNINDNSLNKNDLIMILSDVAHGNFLGLTDIVPENNLYVLNQRVGALKNIRFVSPYFLRVYINLNQTYFRLNGQGSAQLNLGKESIIKFEVSFPNPAEQEKICDIILVMDKEIEQLEAKLEKHKQLKQGMMQSLLTGKIRLV